eukprot:GHVL01032535.1.p1 GENE.GHVL01032535.1~~GHVL01032535.1.p1  ORF type:complete len:247 (+),score=27.83 GHVL01032535.1:74-814(+)
MTTMTTATGETKSVKTTIVTEGEGPNQVTKTIVEETITKVDGTKVVTRTENITSGGATPSSVNADFGRLGLGEDKSKPTSKPGKDSIATNESPQTMDDFHKDCLQAHNEKRKLHGADKLKLASDLSKHAQQWAEDLAAAGKFEHSRCQVGGDRVGENIACSWASPIGADYTGDEVVDQWYSEIKKHDYSSDGAMSSGHFTQVVWKGSKELGVGKAKDGKGKCIVVCNYRPAGNMIGDYKANVAKPK